MQIARFKYKNDLPRFGWIYREKIGRIEGDVFGEYRRLVADIPIQSVKILPPVVPGKIIGVGRNFAEHAKEHGVEIPEIPLIFLKPPSTVIGPDETIEIPPQSKQVEHEAELAVVIGKTGRWIFPEDAQSHIFGYTIANDVTARDLQRRDDQWTRSKGFDTFCPLGPWVETDLDASDTVITCRVNSIVRQMASTREMVFSVNQLIAFISSVMTLSPGDVVLTGTPAGVGQLEAGNIVEISIEGIGVLKNDVRAGGGAF
jgi:2-keto-4-pentenoate hydratase/2-oxohepta-3-ene-1,7-dioic acid hydratase in catechol pathway